MPLSPLICGAMDQNSVWLQWSPSQGDIFEVEVRTAAPKSPGNSERARGARGEWGEWTQWLPVSHGEVARPWGVIPVWRPGWAVQARVRVVGREDWEMASEVTFSRCRALLRVTADEHAQPILWPTNTAIHCVLDGVACSFALDRDFMVQPNRVGEVPATAVFVSGYHQLDHPGHLRVQPALGVVVENVGPSENDLSDPTGRDFTVLEAFVQPVGGTIACLP